MRLDLYPMDRALSLMAWASAGLTLFLSLPFRTRETVCELFLNDGEEAATVLFDDPHGSGSSGQTGLRIVHGGECFASFDVHGLRSLNKRRVAR